MTGKIAPSGPDFINDLLQRVANRILVMIAVVEMQPEPHLCWCNSAVEQNFNLPLQMLKELGTDDWKSRFRFLNPGVWPQLAGIATGNLMDAPYNFVAEIKCVASWQTFYFIITPFNKSIKGLYTSVVVTAFNMEISAGRQHRMEHLIKENALLENQFLLQQLAPRQVEVVKLIAGGKTDKAIAGQLGISIHTAQTHRKNILRKLNCRNTAELIALVSSVGLI